jgi:hypothetical protein
MSTDNTESDSIKVRPVCFHLGSRYVWRKNVEKEGGALLPSAGVVAVPFVPPFVPENVATYILQNMVGLYELAE